MKKFLFLLMPLFTFGFQCVKAQETPTRIVTNHPDFKIKVSRCAASGKTVVIDFVLTNAGTQDIDGVMVYGGGSGPWSTATEAYDSEGNIYKNEEAISIRMANFDEYSREQKFDLIPDVPMKMSIRINGVPTSVESIARLKIEFRCPKWGLNYDKPVVIRNIPISRD